MEATDWSWGALIFDMDNDGRRDIFVANGIYQDLTDQDYLNFISDQETKRMIITKEGVDFKRLIDSIPVRPVPNYAFHNQGFTGGMARIPRFENMAEDWGFDQKTFSNGSAYGDLDGDGDLDLVINNVNMPAMLYRSEVTTKRADHHWIEFELEGQGANPFAIGTKLVLFAGEDRYYLEHMPMRGFQSTMDYTLHTGLGDHAQLDSLIAYWPDGRQTLRRAVDTDQKLTLRQAEANAKGLPLPQPQEPTEPIFAAEEESPLGFVHEESSFSDFDRDRLLYHMRSTEGPCVALADVNGDGRVDVYLGGAKRQPGQLKLQQRDGTFRSVQEELFAADAVAEETDALFFDANGDRRPDLYVVSGGNELPNSSTGLGDRLYLNQGGGRFAKSDQVLPAGRFESTSCVDAADVDSDGDLDLFVGTRMKPFAYGQPVNGYLLRNDGQGNFSNVTAEVAPELIDLGLITDARWGDLDGDGDPDLTVVGEWMAIEVFLNEAGQLSRHTEAAGLARSQGWWTCLEPADLDGDGDLDFVVGNHGLNSRFEASDSLPIYLYLNDFDDNGRDDPIMCRYESGKLLPYARLGDLTKQMPVLKRRYLRFSSYVGQEMDQIFSEEKLASALRLEARQLASVMLINDGQGHFVQRELPLEAQVAPLYGILADDFDRDGLTDLLLGGNLHHVKPEMGRYDASYGLMLKGLGQGVFDVRLPRQTGMRLEGEVRDLAALPWRGKSAVLVVRNDDEAQIFTY